MRIDLKKQKKKAALVQAAYELFIDRGVGNTVVSDITERAGVAKGTFYLYFRDKEDVVDAVVVVLCRHILESAYRSVMGQEMDNFVDKLVQIADWIINYFQQNKPVLELIQRNFRWPVLKEKFLSDGDSVWKTLVGEVRASGLMRNRTANEIFKTLYCLVSMCGAVAYSSIIRGEPESIEKMKPIIFSIIRSSLSI